MGNGGKKEKGGGREEERQRQSVSGRQQISPLAMSGTGNGTVLLSAADNFFPPAKKINKYRATSGDESLNAVIQDTPSKIADIDPRAQDYKSPSLYCPEDYLRGLGPMAIMPAKDWSGPFR